MKHSMYWMMPTLSLCLALVGCGKPQPAAEPSTPAAQPEAAAPAAPDAAALAPAAPEADTTEAEPSADALKVVAKVGDHDITEGDVQKVVRMFSKQMGGRVPPEQMAEAMPRIRERIVEELVMRQVMLAEVAKAGISLSDSEFEQVKSEMAGELPEGTTLADYLAETGTTEAEMREQMAVRKMIVAKAESIAKPTDEEIQAFYDENKEGFAQDESVTASHILIKFEDGDDDAAKTAKRERIEGLRKQLQEGADFAELAQAHSDCPSSTSGGDLGPFGRGQMVPAFEDAAFSQPTGSVGDVVETQFGYHLIKVTEHKAAKALEFNEVKTRISDILYSQKQQDAVKEYVDGLRAAANIQRFDPPPAEETLLQLDAEEEAPAAAETAVEEVAAAAPAAVEVAVEEVKDAAAPVAEEVVEEVQEVAAEAAAAVETAVEEVKDAAAEAAAAIEPAAEEAAEAAVEEAVPAAEEKAE
ncbi:MAG: peptidylprolyl isomerase [Kiritimatiellia bacterium]